MKKLYICCPRHLRPVLKAEAEIKYQDKYLIHDVLTEADLVYVVGDKNTEMAQEIVKANKLGIPIMYGNEKFRNEEVYEALLSNKKQVKVVPIVKEKNKTKER